VARISTETWKPLTTEDERVFGRSRQIQNICENLTESQRKMIDRANREVFHRGKPTLNQIIKLQQMRTGVRASRGDE
jgi:hypothetical protein